MAESFDFNLERFTTFAHGETKFFLLMELMVVKDLTVVMMEKSNGVQLTDIKICTIACNMFDGLAFIHEQGFIHNGVEPDNTGLTFKPFGAVILDVGNGERLQVSYDHKVGVIGWFSPRRMMLKRQCIIDKGFDLRRLPASTSKADVWAAALCCLELLQHGGAPLINEFETEHGVRGVTSSSLSRIIAKLRVEEGDAIGATRQLYAVLISALAYGAESRPSAKEMLKQLEEVRRSLESERGAHGEDDEPAKKKARTIT